MGQDLHRRANTAAVLRTLAEQGAASVAGLRSAVGLSRPTLEAILADLVAAGAVQQREPQEPEGAGRPARTYAIDPDAGYVAGVDVGRHKVLVLVADASGAIRVTERATVPPETDGAHLLDLLKRTISAATAELGIEVSGLRALGVGVPGIVDQEGRVTRSVVVPQWTGLDVRGQLASWAGVDVEVANDANLAVLAEQWRGAAREHDDVVYLLAGRRTRVAIMVDGEVLTGRRGEAGEIGSVPELFFDTPEVLLGDSAADSGRVGEVFRQALDGDPTSRARVDRYCAELARTIRVVTAVLDPEIVVIGGGLAGAGGQIIDGLRRHLDPDTGPPGFGVPLAASTLTDAAVALGGVRRAQRAAAATDPWFEAVLSADAPPPRQKEPL